jgi:hypothetical protein
MRANIPEQTQESLKPDSDLREVSRSLRKRLRRFLEGRVQTSHAARIRRIYGELMALSARLEHPRPRAVTPLEFLNTLNVLFPSAAAELATITSAYIKVRYGEFPESPQELQGVLLAWERVRAQGELHLHKRKSG